MKAPIDEATWPRTRLTATLGGDGRPGPIEQRIGRRLVRIVDPESAEGRRLLAERAIEWIGPDGASLGELPARDAFRLLIDRLERSLERIADGSDGLDGLDDVERRLQRAIDEIRQRDEALAPD